MGRAEKVSLTRLIAHFRPQPAIPAVFVLLLTIMFANTSEGGWAAWGVPAGILISCGLAVAAGFCSLFPQLAWLALAFLGANALVAASAPGVGRPVLMLGIFAACCAFLMQLWRARTGRFTPTVGEAS